MSIFKIIRANTLPSVFEPNALYFVANDTNNDLVDVYVTGNTSSTIKRVSRPYEFDTRYSIMSVVADSLPASPMPGQLVWVNNSKTLYKYNGNTWIQIPWQSYIKSCPEYQVGSLRINPDSKALEITSDNTNWYECIPVLGADIVELTNIDNSTYDYKYYVLPGQTVVFRNANHIPIVYSQRNSRMLLQGTVHMNITHQHWIGIRPNDDGSIADVPGQYIHVSGTNISAQQQTLILVPISYTDNTTALRVVDLKIYLDQRNIFVKSITQPDLSIVSSVWASTNTYYWLGPVYTDTGAPVTIDVATLTRIL